MSTCDAFCDCFQLRCSKQRGHEPPHCTSDGIEFPFPRYIPRPSGPKVHPMTHALHAADQGQLQTPAQELLQEQEQAAPFRGGHGAIMWCHSCQTWGVPRPLGKTDYHCGSCGSDKTAYYFLLREVRDGSVAYPSFPPRGPR